MRDVRASLIDGGLPQRSRATRSTAIRIIQTRLTSWNPPLWVLDDLMSAERANDLTRLRSLLLLHYARQETLVYDFVQQVLAPRWQTGEVQVVRDDVQRFLDSAAPRHPEIAAWSYETRVKLAGNLLTTLRDYGLLAGRAPKRIVEPVVDAQTAHHLQRLLEAEGVGAARLVDHPDWRIWLLWSGRVASLLQGADELARVL